MLKRALLGLCGVFLLLVVALAVGLTWAHVAIRRERAPLPDVGEVVAMAKRPDADRPVALFWINTATQAMPRAAVLDPRRDPNPEAPYRMSHPAFVLAWADGRLLLVDTGMTHDEAISFGRVIELVAGASPIEPHGSVASHLGSKRTALQAIIFTHLHTDHVGGLTELCGKGAPPISVFMTEAQTERPNFTTRPGLRVIRAAACARPERLAGSGLMPVRGFPGVSVIDAGGHTPGSQIVLAEVASPDGTRRFAFAGDTVNHLDGILHEIPKPFLYRLVMVPEDDTRLGELRGFLRQLRSAGEFTILVSHDQQSLEASGIAPWPE